MKLTFVNTLYAPNGLGGAERTVQTLAEALVARGHQASVISLAPDGRASDGELNGVRTHYVPLANLHWPFAGDRGARSALRRAAWHVLDAYNPVMGARVGRILDAERPDVVQTSNLLGFSAAAWGAARRRGLPVVQMLHDYYLACPNSSMFRRGRNCERQCGACRAYATPRRLLSGTPDAVISLSWRVLERVEACGLFPHQSQRRAIIHGASSMAAHAPEHERPARGPDSLTVGYLGRLESTKGIEFVLDAARAVQGRQVRVLLGGKGAEPYASALRERYASPDVEFLGHVEPADFFRQIDVLMVPSQWEEPLGRVIYEAYAHGVPVIVTRLGGMPEIVEEGLTGYVVAPGDGTGLTRLLHRLAGNWSSGLYERACLEKSQEFRVEHLIDRYLAVWRHAAGLPPGTPPPRAPELVSG